MNTPGDLMSLYQSVEHGEVIALMPDNKARVKIPRRSTCQGCSHRSFCDPFGSEHMVVEALNSVQARNGQRVEVSFGREKQSKAIFILYIIPLVALILGAAAGNALDPFNNQDASSAVLSILCVALAFVGIRIYSTKRSESHPDQQPVITSILTSSTHNGP